MDNSVDLQSDYSYFIKSVKVPEASRLLQGKKLNDSYIVVLDTGIDKKYYKSYKHKLIYDATYSTDIAPSDLNPWDSFNYQSLYSHGTEVNFVIHQIIKELVPSNLNILRLSYPIRTINFKIYKCPSGIYMLEHLAESINKIIDYYVLTKHLNIAAISYSSSTTGNDFEATQLAQDAINRASSHGITFVTSSGNENIQIHSNNAMLDDVIVVGGTDQNNNRATWANKDGKVYGSNYGSHLDIVAPGKDILVFTKGNTKYYRNGTSYSAPMVSAAVGIIKSIDPKLTHNQVKEILIKMSTKLGCGDRDDYLGYGLLNFEKIVEYTLNGRV